MSQTQQPPEPTYLRRGHRVQARNEALADLVFSFAADRDDAALLAGVRVRSPGEQMMLLAYLINMDFAGAAQNLARELGLDLVRGLLVLDAENGREFAAALGWVRGA
jgi:hypothetical protein